jgi:hypothetical protein
MDWKVLCTGIFKVVYLVALGDMFLGVRTFLDTVYKLNSAVQKRFRIFKRSQNPLHGRDTETRIPIVK